MNIDDEMVILNYSNKKIKTQCPILFYSNEKKVSFSQKGALFFCCYCKPQTQSDYLLNNFVFLIWVEFFDVSSKRRKQEKK
jgi:hypothetical protein